MTDINEFREWLADPEGLHLEFKKAENSLSQNNNLPDYCAALSNAGGGKASTLKPALGFKIGYIFEGFWTTREK